MAAASLIPAGDARVVPPHCAAQTIVEGSATVLYAGRESVFYNPAQIMNRDLSVFVVRAFDAARREAATKSDARRLWGRLGLIAPSVDSAATLPGLRILEALAASGLRSVRYAKEIPGVDVIVVNDMDDAAIESIRSNMTFNGLRVGPAISTMNLARFAVAGPPDALGSNAAAAVSAELPALAPHMGPIIVPSHGDANMLMYLHRPPPPGCSASGPRPDGRGAAEPTAVFDRGGGGDGASSATIPGFYPSAPTSGGYAFLPFDVVDLDPYGSASPFLDAAVGCVADGGLLAVTCTDMTVLAGNHKDACHGKYGAIPVKGPHYAEQAVRMVLGAIEAAAVRHRKAITPLLSLSIDFYVRVFVRVADAPRESALSPLKLGHLQQCTGCDSYWIWPKAKWDSSATAPSKGAAPSGKRPRKSALAASAAAGEDEGAPPSADAAVADADGAAVEDSSSIGVKRTRGAVVDEGGTDGPTAAGAAAGSADRASPRQPAASASSSSASSASAWGYRTTFDSTRGRPAGSSVGRGHPVANYAPPPLPSRVPPHPREEEGEGEGPGSARPAAGSAAAAAAAAAAAGGEAETGAGKDVLCNTTSSGVLAGSGSRRAACPHCSETVLLAGPLWIDPMHDAGFVARVLALMRAEWTDSGCGVPAASATAPAHFYDLSRTQLRPETDAGSNDVAAVATSRRRVQAMLRSAAEELPDAPLAYDASALACKLHAPNFSWAAAAVALRGAGYRTSGSHAAPNMLKTDAPPAALWSMLRAWTRLPGNAVAAKHLADTASMPATLLRNAAAADAEAAATEAEAAGRGAAVGADGPRWSFGSRGDAAAVKRASRQQGPTHIPAPTANWGPLARASAAKGRMAEKPL